MINFFLKPLAEGWVYPCTIEDIQNHVTLVPPEDIEGLWAVGLVPSTKKDASVNGRYIRDEKPKIYLYSYPENLAHRYPAHTTRADVEHWRAIELEYGMVIRNEGSRLVCQWQPDYLRRFMLEHVLTHEIGHHVHYKQRCKEGLSEKVSFQVSEQFADSYAVRWQRKMGLIKY